ncbi:hypothetical protein Y1Q_0003876 [Alligator mississippiensis]|uniref:Uncharacterized protein n=1 Tax=Alligator mississippiensis TaxID=8496 RepID=A0A151MNL1_ALLMI|nr:hypothetical protein Y1Q_0003876 [Alligator mississippiensis]
MSSIPGRHIGFYICINSSEFQPSQIGACQNQQTVEHFLDTCKMSADCVGEEEARLPAPRQDHHQTSRDALQASSSEMLLKTEFQPCDQLKADSRL